MTDKKTKITNPETAEKVNEARVETAVAADQVADGKIVPATPEEVKVGAHTSERPQATETRVETALPATQEPQDERDLAAENLIRWGAARAGVIAVAPLVGSVALMANEVYMISRLAKVYDVKLSDRTIMSFLGAFGARVVGKLAATLIPIPGVAVPVAVTVTYGMGRVAQSWIKDGMPLDVKPYMEKFEDLKAEGEAKVQEIANDAKKDIPLGDEGKDFAGGKGCPVKKGAAKFLDMADKGVTELLLALGVSQAEIDDKKALAKGVYEVTKETATEVAEELKVRLEEATSDAKLQANVLRDRAEVKAAELKELAQEKAEEAKIKAGELKEQAQEKAAELKEQAQEKAGELKEKAQIKAEEARVKAQELKVQAQDKAEELKEKAQEKAEEAKAKAQELKEQAQDKAEEVKEQVQEKAAEAKEKAEDLKADVKEKAEDVKEQAKDKAEELKDRVEEKKAEAKKNSK